MAKYRRIRQKPYCCVPACIQMILVRRGLKVVSQGEIGAELGLVVPPRYARMFPKAKVTRKRPRWGYGARVKWHPITRFFRKFGIPLVERYVPPSDGIAAAIRWNLAAGNDAIACFNNKALWGRGDHGHVSLIEAVGDGPDPLVTLVDPDGAVGRKRARLSRLAAAMRLHRRHRNRGGLWVVSTTR